MKQKLSYWICQPKGRKKYQEQKKRVRNPVILEAISYNIYRGTDADRTV